MRIFQCPRKHCQHCPDDLRAIPLWAEIAVRFSHLKSQERRSRVEKDLLVGDIQRMTAHPLGSNAIWVLGMYHQVHTKSFWRTFHPAPPDFLMVQLVNDHKANGNAKRPFNGWLFSR